MKRALRFTGCMLVVIASAAWLVHVYLFVDFASTRSPAAQPESGRTIPLNNHGVLVYLTAEEGGLLNWLSYGALVAFVAGAVVLRFQAGGRKVQ